jgi:glycosyltransferase involved in cell wall biosynthesis
MDVFVSASRAEGMSNSVMEAMAVGRIAVTTDARGASLFVGPSASSSGIPFAPTENALANAIAAVASVRDRSTALAASAKQKATREFSVAAMVDAYESVYADLALSSSSRG